MMSELKRLEQLTGESDQELLSFLLEQAKNYMLVETNRKVLPTQLELLAVDYAAYLYRRQTNAGETSRSEGGVSVTYDNSVPDYIQEAVKKYRLARVGGHVFEAKQT